MMKRTQAVEEQESSGESVAQVAPKQAAAKSRVKSKVRLFHEKSQSLDLDNQRREYNKNDVKLMNQDCYNRVRQQKDLLQKNHSVNVDADLAEERRVRREVRKLNAWLVQKSMEHQERQEWSKTELLRSRTAEKKTLLPESAFKSFDSSSIVSSIEDEMNKLTIEADVHNGNVPLVEQKPETNKVSESDSDLLLEAKLIRTEGKLVKLASIDELIEYEQGER